MVQEIQAVTAPHPIAAFPTTFLQLAALCRRSRLLIAGDTGPLHLAVALGTPTVAIMGPTSPWRNGPFNEKDPIVKRYLFCSNSYKRTCNQFICMDIPVQEVFDAVTRRLAS
jgi:ADP-heptose:LPS heptosyltransferase